MTRWRGHVVVVCLDGKYHSMFLYWWREERIYGAQEREISKGIKSSGS